MAQRAKAISIKACTSEINHLLRLVEDEAKKGNTYLKLSHLYSTSIRPIVINELLEDGFTVVTVPTKDEAIKTLEIRWSKPIKP